MSRRARTLLAVAAAALLLALPAGAQAYFTAGGSTTATASVATLPAPTLTATPGSASVRLEWTAISAPASGSVTYYVTRDGGAPSAACPSAASPSAVTSCTDSGVAIARHDYTVTAVWRSWTGRSATTDATVTHGPVTQLVFTTQPGGGATGGLAFPTQPVVTARDAAGNTVTDYTGEVRLAIQSGGAAGAELSGCVASLANGVTSFSGCAIDRASGSNYVLRASDGTLGVNSSGFSVGTGAAAQLVFTTQPGNGTGGSAFSTQPVVRAADAGGNPIGGSYGGTVTLSIVPGSGAADARLSECLSSRSSGVTTFSRCEIDRAASGYRLRASDGTISGDSNAFNVTVGSTADIVFTTQPGGGATGGLAFPTQPVVTAVDAGGNTVTSYSSTVGLEIASGPSGGDLDNCVGTRVSGVTTFSGCELDRAGTYVLRADDGPRDDQSASFRVDVGPVAEIAVTTNPSGATAGRAFSTQPAVGGFDAGGNAVTSYAGPVALSITPGTGASGATLSGCTPLTPSGGIVRFSGCSIDRSGSGYRLRATDGTLTDDSSTFSVSAGAPAQLEFTTQPGGATANASFATQPVVTALDAFGNVATSYNGTVTLAIKSGTGTAGATLSNCDDDESGGVTEFTGCRINRLGTGYVLTARDNRGLTTTESAPFDVTAGRATRLLLAAATTRQVAGAANDLTITALDAGGNVATSYTGVKRLEFGGASTPPSGIASTVTNNAGSAIAFGRETLITFVDGVARASGGANGTMVLRDDGSDSVTVTDDTISQASALTVTVATGAPARLAWTNVSAGSNLSNPCYFTCTKTSASSGGTFRANVTVTDSEGNVVSDIGSNHRATLSTPTSGAGSGGRFTAPSNAFSITLTFASSGAATTTSSFTFTNQGSGSWTTHTFTATSVADGYTAATATIVN